MMRLIRALTIGLLAAFVACSGGSDTPLFVDAVDYDAMTPEGGCPGESDNAIYRSCLDNEDVYNAALASAKEAGNPLMVIWGFNECPYCKVFDAENFDPERPWTTSAFIGKLTKEQRAALTAEERTGFQISLVRLHSRTSEGLKFADKIGVTEMARARGNHRVWSPFIMVVNPETGVIHTEEKWNAQWSFCESASEFIVNLVAIGALPDDGGHAWPMCASQS